MKMFKVLVVIVKVKRESRKFESLGGWKKGDWFRKIIGYFYSYESEW